MRLGLVANVVKRHVVWRPQRVSAMTCQKTLKTCLLTCRDIGRNVAIKFDDISRHTSSSRHVADMSPTADNIGKIRPKGRVADIDIFFFVVPAQKNVGK